MVRRCRASPRDALARAALRAPVRGRRVRRAEGDLLADGRAAVPRRAPASWRWEDPSRPVGYTASPGDGLLAYVTARQLVEERTRPH